MQRRCAGTNKRGEPCRSFAVTGSDYCRMHSPEHREQVDADRLKGGAGKGTSVRAARQWLRLGEMVEPEQLPGLLVGAGLAVLEGTLEPRQASAFAQCLRAAAQIQESALFDARLRELDRLVRMLGGPTDDTG